MIHYEEALRQQFHQNCVECAGLVACVRSSIPDKAEDVCSTHITDAERAYDKATHLLESLQGYIMEVGPCEEWADVVNDVQETVDELENCLGVFRRAYEVSERKV